jgi:hypothetical protein
MWTIIKVNKNQVNLLKKDFLKKLKSETVFYMPKTKVLTQKKKENIVYFLSDYVICYNKLFSNKKTVNSLKYSKGLKYFLNGYHENQNEIKKFVDLCRKNENENGSISIDFFNVGLNSKFKFISGPFKNLIFSVLEVQRKKLKILIGDLNTIISKKNLFVRPI